MAKSKDFGEPPLPHHPEPPPPEPPPPMPPAEAPPADKDKDATIAALQARLAELEAAQKAAGVEPRAAAAGVYRVSLSGAPAYRPTAHVEPRPQRFDTDLLKKKLADLGKDRTAVYDALELHIADPKKGTDVMARERFIKERNLGDIDPSCFRVRMDLGEQKDGLEIAAGSPWEAEAIYRAFNGISATTGPFTTILLEGKGEQGRQEEQGGKHHGEKKEK